MFIGIDGNEANVKFRVGSNIFAFEVIRHLAKKNFPAYFEIYLRDPPMEDFPKERENWRYKVFGPRKLWTQFALPLHLHFNRKKPNVFFTPGHYAPRFCPAPSVISILDTSYLLFPQYFRKRDLIQLEFWSAYSIKNAKKIITISNSTKKDIIKYYKVDEEKVVVIYPGFNKETFRPTLPSKESTAALLKYSITKPYILFVGTIQPRKNLLTLIKAFKEIAKTKKDLNLVITGKTGWLYNEIIEEAKTALGEKRIIFTGFAEEKDLSFLYKEACCFVLPSLYEGFGIPVVEAMSVGCPVVVSDNSSLSEIAERSGILIDPSSVKSLKEGIEKVLSLNPNQREAIIKKGIERSKNFSWEKASQQIYQVFKESAL